METALKLAFSLLVDFLGYGFGRGLLWVLTLGRYRSRADDFFHVSMLGTLTAIPLIGLAVWLLSRH